MDQGISAGFPSPAQDFIDLSIDLNKELIKHPSSTFFGRVKGCSMKDAGIDNGDLLIVDKSINPTDGKIAVCFIDGEFTVKRLKVEKDCCWLVPENESYEPIRVTAENDFMVWGIVIYVIKAL
jgi:DNA polymerase V